MLSCTNLSLGYPQKNLIQGLNLELRQGERWAVIGKNGSGKTTLLHAMAGLNDNAMPRLFFRGERLDSFSRRVLAQNIGLLIQQEDRNFYGNVMEYVSLGRFPHDDSIFGWRARSKGDGLEEIDRVGLSSLRSRPVISLSGGEWQRARIALLLAQHPEVYLLDEPLQHLDLHHQKLTLDLFLNLAKNEGKIIVMVLHELTWLSRYCDYVLLLYENSAPVAGPASEVLTLSNLENLYQCRLKTMDTDEGTVFLPI